MNDEFEDSLASPPPSQQEVDNLVIAAGDGKQAEVTAFLDKYKDSIDRKNRHGNTALIYAAWLGQGATVELLLAKGAFIDAKSGAGLTALMAAAWKGRVDTVRLLLEKGAAIDAADGKGKTARMLAAEEKYLETAALIGQYADIRRRKAQEFSEIESKKLIDAHLEKLKSRRPPQSPFNKNQP